jgi:hypothetical protein
MTKKTDFSYQVDTIDNDTIVIKLKGSIMEKANFDPLLKIPAKNVRIDLEQIEYFNSSGVHLWVDFLASLCNQSTVFLERCGNFVVGQMNMIPNMRGKATVRSVMLSYFCLDCDYEDKSCLEIGQIPPPIEKQRACPQCKGVMEFADAIEGYLNFLKKKTASPSGS